MVHNEKFMDVEVDTESENERTKELCEGHVEVEILSNDG